VVLVALGTLAGIRYGGGYGGLAGGIAAGAAINAWRALKHYQMGTPDGDKEAMVSGSYAVGAAILSAVVATKLASPTGASIPLLPNKSDDDVEGNPRCGIRKVGP
jgi:hypothetical protein